MYFCNVISNREFESVYDFTLNNLFSETSELR
jgi:hypothetical protein